MGACYFSLFLLMGKRKTVLSFSQQLICNGGPPLYYRNRRSRPPSPFFPIFGIFVQIVGKCNKCIVQYHLLSLSCRSWWGFFLQQCSVHGYIFFSVIEPCGVQQVLFLRIMRARERSEERGFFPVFVRPSFFLKRSTAPPLPDAPHNNEDRQTLFFFIHTLHYPLDVLIKPLPFIIISFASRNVCDGGKHTRLDRCVVGGKTF